jgi:hypothetical protein
MYYQVNWFFFLARKQTQGKRETDGQAERGREGGRQSFFPSISLLSLPFYLSLSLCSSVCLSACSTISLSLCVAEPELEPEPPEPYHFAAIRTGTRTVIFL